MGLFYKDENGQISRVGNGENSQVSVLPSPSTSNLGNVYQYIGTTDANYVNGFFYKCVSNGLVPPTYSWVQIDVQPASGGESTPREEKVIATAPDFRTAGQGSYSFKTSTAVTITLSDANTITIPANTQGLFDIGETDTTLNDYIGVIQYTYNGYEKIIYFNSTVFYMPTTDSVQIDDTTVSSATTYSSAKIETVIGTSKAAQMTGATAYQDGKEGLATKPVAGDNQKALFGDGKYHTIYTANTGSTVVIVTDETSLYGRAVTLTAGSVTLTGTMSNTGECTFSNLAVYGAVQISCTDSEGNIAMGSTNITYFGTYVVGIGFNFATIKFTSTDISLAGTPVAIYLGNTLVAETSLSLVSGSLEARCYVEQLGTYKAIAETLGGTARASVTVSALKQTYTAELVVADIYGFVIDHTDSNPATCVKPYDLTDYEVLNTSFTPAYMDFTNDRFVWGSWTGNEFFFPKPCMLGYDGDVDYYLDPDDFTKKADGTASDVADMSYNGNVMVEFPTIYFKRWQIDNKSYCLIANKQLDSDFHAWAHHDKNGKILPYIYLSVYKGSYDGVKTRSISGIEYHNQNQLTLNKIISHTTRQQEMNFAQNNNTISEQGEGWYIRHKAEWDMVNDLLLLIGMNTNTQTTFGRGRDTGYSSTTNTGISTTGLLNNKGMFWGTNDGSIGVKVFGVENWWGNLWDSTAGWVNDHGNQKVKMTYGQEDGSTVTGYNLDGTGYIAISNSTPSGSNGGYVNKYKRNEFGLFPIETSGSSSTYLCDGLWFANGQNNFALVGGNSSDGTRCGALFSILFYNNTNATWDTGTSLTYKGIAS